MANGLFIPSFRGPGTPGVPGVGSTQRGLQAVTLGGQKVEAGGLALQGTRDTARLNSIVQGAIQLKQIADPQLKLAFLQQRKRQLVQAGISTEDTDAGIAFLEAGDLAGLEEVTDQAISLGQAPAAPFTLRPGETRFGGGGAAIATGGPKPVELSPLQKKIAAEGIDPNSKEGFARAKELNQRAATDPSLKRTDQQILSKANDAQLKAAGFANRAKASNKVLKDLENKPDFDPTSLIERGVEAAGGQIFLSEDRKLYNQAKEDFVTAVLRAESGAVISDTEFAREEKKFFPQLGDGVKVIRRKRASRTRAFENLRNQSKGVFDVQFKNPEVFEKIEPEFTEGQTATNPQTGQKMVFTNGQWTEI